ncbi:FlgO family outer membrane protein [Thalassotalea piscium]|uniref:TolB-like protein n=1 Tax=Thalassotalea piscium TaxID=1230533 RepID=A0A7X0TU27_9GAMM|nr:FlgO family outer membrane protein [Thalassotalea piscium]MBB6543763.1 TolB-like protein [Thalassotalea piscium]
MKNLISAACVAALLTGCSTIDNSVSTQANETQVQTNNELAASGAGDALFRFPKSTMNNKTDEEIFQGPALTKNINFYMRGLMQDLVSNLEYVNGRTPVAVTSFVNLDSDFESSSLLGNQIAESLMHEIHKVGIPVLDYKVTDYLRVTEQGDFIMSRNFNELTNNIPIRYVFTGNLVKHQGGYLVNARVVGIKSKAVVASAQSFIPASVAKAILDTEPRVSEQQIPLIQG